MDVKSTHLLIITTVEHAELFALFPTLTQPVQIQRAISFLAIKDTLIVMVCRSLEATAAKVLRVNWQLIMITGGTIWIVHLPKLAQVLAMEVLPVTNKYQPPNCKVAYQGYFYAFCEEGFYREGDYCITCTSGGGKALAQIATVALIFFGVTLAVILLEDTKLDAFVGVLSLITNFIVGFGGLGRSIYMIIMLSTIMNIPASDKNYSRSVHLLAEQGFYTIIAVTVFSVFVVVPIGIKLHKKRKGQLAPSDVPPGLNKRTNSWFVAEQPPQNEDTNQTQQNPTQQSEPNNQIDIQNAHVHWPPILNPETTQTQTQQISQTQHNENSTRIEVSANPQTQSTQQSHSHNNEQKRIQASTNTENSNNNNANTLEPHHLKLPVIEHSNVTSHLPPLTQNEIASTRFSPHTPHSPLPPIKKE
eukprot:TRINITY_DN606_c0_g1_i1.p1 TRINITY_DN606_c0_g1~~TRINITY_DN606_c0_g1_i1.p1  ORF type:complete len:417 (+),score=91.35 TRINITY_DN606_c0_g1_i1:1262-2512(+)